MSIKPIRNEADYNSSLKRICTLMTAKPNSSEGDELDVLVTLVKHYEKTKHPINYPNPIEAIRFRMDQTGLKDKDLIPFVGHSGRVSEVLNFRRKLTLTMIRKLHSGLNIPVKSLIQDYELNQQ